MNAIGFLPLCISLDIEAPINKEAKEITAGDLMDKSFESKKNKAKRNCNGNYPPPIGAVIDAPQPCSKSSRTDDDALPLDGLKDWWSKPEITSPKKEKKGNGEKERESAEMRLVRLLTLIDGEATSKNASFILGHNIIEHDLNIIKCLLEKKEIKDAFKKKLKEKKFFKETRTEKLKEFLKKLGMLLKKRRKDPNLHLLTLPVIDTLRLSPLAYPCEHSHKLDKSSYNKHPLTREEQLQKHIEQGGNRRNFRKEYIPSDPRKDALLTLKLFEKQFDELSKLNKSSESLLAAWHYLCTPKHRGRGVDTMLDQFFRKVRNDSPRPRKADADEAIKELLTINCEFRDITCKTSRNKVVANTDKYGWALAYVLARLVNKRFEPEISPDKTSPVASGIYPAAPWIYHNFPEETRLINCLRNTPCADPDCDWCARQKRHDSQEELKRWLKIDNFELGQQAIVEKVMAKEHVFGILPVGTGKSPCYQVPALSRYGKTGALTIMILPHIAEVSAEGQELDLQKNDMICYVDNYGQETQEKIEKTTEGHNCMLILDSAKIKLKKLLDPKLKPNSDHDYEFDTHIKVRQTLENREIDTLILDEPQRLLKDAQNSSNLQFFNDFIRKQKEEIKKRPEPFSILLLTETADQKEIEEVKSHFKDEISIDLLVVGSSVQ